MRIKLILRGKRLGLALSEIRELLDLYEVARNERAQLTKFLALLAERRARACCSRARTSRPCWPRSTASSAIAGGGSRTESEARRGRRLTFT